MTPKQRTRALVLLSLLATGCGQQRPTEPPHLVAKIVKRKETTQAQELDPWSLMGKMTQSRTVTHYWLAFTDGSTSEVEERNFVAFAPGDTVMERSE